MGDNYVWNNLGTAFDQRGSWDDYTTTQDPAAQPPGPSDQAGLLGGGGTVTGNGDVDTLQVSGNFTFTGDITAETSISFDFNDDSGAATVSGGSLTGKTDISIYNGTVNVIEGGSLATNDGTDSFGSLLNFSTISVNDGTLTSYALGDGGALMMDGGTIDASILTVGDGAGATLDLDSGATITDSSANIGNASGDDSTATVQDGDWTSSNNMDIGLDSAGTLEVMSGGSVDITGSGTYALVMGLLSGDASLDIAGGMMSVTGDAVVGGSGAGNVSISDGGSLDVMGTLDAGAMSGGSGTLDLSDGDGTLSVGDEVTIGDGGSGDLDIGEGSSVSLQGALTLAGMASGKGTLSLGQDVTLAPGGSLNVAFAGTATVSLDAGAMLDGSAGAFVVGGTTNAAGTITLGGAGATVKANDLVVGAVGTGLISVGESASLSVSGDLTLGQTHGGGNGTVTVAASADLSVSGSLNVGSGGIGSLDVNGGSLTIGGALGIAEGTASSGDMTFANATLSIGTITVGNLGTGTFSANQAANVTATQIVLGTGSTGNGTFNVDGTGSEVQAGSMQVGNGGTGALQVTNNALLQVTGLATMGATAAKAVQETATIESNANWTVGSELDIGQAATGVVMVDTGGHVSAPSVVLGDEAVASGTVSLTGTGILPSSLGFGTLQVGNLGTGDFTLMQGAQAGTSTTAGTVEIAATAGAIGTITLSGAGTKLQAELLTVGGAAGGAGGNGTLQINGTAEVSVASATVWSTGTVTLGGGTLATDPMTLDGEVSGNGTVSGAIVNNGTISAQGGALTLAGSLSGSGLLTFSGDATLVLSSPGTGISAPILGLAGGDRIEFGGLSISSAQVTSPGTVSISTSGATYLLTDVGFTGGTSQSFQTGHDSATGDDYIQVACFAAGTRIATERGEIPVEALCDNDRVLRAGGGSAEVIWIGHRRIDCHRHPRPRSVLPVRVRAGAFGNGRPHRDLLLSPDHAVFLSGVLIPIRRLVDGHGIAQIHRASVAYYHVELPAHDVILAEGLPCESYLDTGNRANFANAGSVATLHPDFASLRWEVEACAPFIVTGPRLQAARDLLRRQATALPLSQSYTLAG